MKRILAMCITIVLCFSMVACGGRDERGNKDNASGENKSEVQSETSPYYFKENVVVLQDLKIEITKYKIIKSGEKGNENGDKTVIAFWYKVTNLSGELDGLTSSVAWSVVFTATQDNDPSTEKRLNHAAKPDKTLHDTMNETIKKGGTAEGAVAYELVDTKTPVTLKAQRGAYGTIGEQTYEVK